ncbi:hypothetical protein M8C21_002935 [Ambrosia artemisiifolia]|uniref:Uncharacterized protein n=1 Tax=Ambrosia artemisiifolia TaxID=4212 RepID=A0AAD5CKH4_AMBAR|nr:hypothetical protein M8C21_002935 [Ambrosia artemisiifolia]
MPETMDLAGANQHQLPANGFDVHSRNFYFTFNAILAALLVPLISFVQLMYQNEEHSPFKTHPSFMIISVVSLAIAIVTSVALLYIDSQIRIIFRTVAYFAALASPLSLLFVLFIRADKYYWVGYSLLCLVFAVVVVINVFAYINLRGKKDDDPLQMVN